MRPTSRDGFEDSMFEAKAKAKAKPVVFKAKAKATILGPRAVLELEDSPRGLHPCLPVYTIR